MSILAAEMTRSSYMNETSDPGPLFLYFLNLLEKKGKEWEGRVGGRHLLQKNTRRGKIFQLTIQSLAMKEGWKQPE